MKLKNYTRRPFSVDAVQVALDNVAAVAQLCKGTIVIHDDKVEYIQVPVKRPASPKQAQAHIGDWVVYHQRGWKVYGDDAFKKTFQETVAVANDLEAFAKRENG